VQNGLLLSLVAAAAGSAVAIVMGDSKGRMLPLVCSMTLSAVAIGFLQFISDGEWFFLAACLFNFAWYFFLPYISATVAAIDDSGQFLTLLAVAFPLSLAAGPAFASFLLGWSDSFSNVLIFGLCSVPIGISLILPAARTASTPKDPATTL
jgi:predicted MFS family arabinose efflux permease